VIRVLTSLYLPAVQRSIRIIELTMNQAQVEHAAPVGFRRQIESMKDGRHHRHGFDGENEWEFHIQSACAECATAAALNRHWPAGVNTFKQPDVTPDIQVRWRSDPSYDLLVRPDDNPEEKFVLVYGRCPKFQIIGWEIGKDAMQDRHKANHGDRPTAYFVKKEFVRPIEELILKI